MIQKKPQCCNSEGCLLTWAESLAPHVRIGSPGEGINWSGKLFVTNLSLFGMSTVQRGKSVPKSQRSANGSFALFVCFCPTFRQGVKTCGEYHIPSRPSRNWLIVVQSQCKYICCKFLQPLIVWKGPTSESGEAKSEMSQRKTELQAMESLAATEEIVLAMKVGCRSFLCWHSCDQLGAR